MSARPLTEKEYRQITKFLARAGRTRDRLIFVLACATGFRVSELLSLTIGQVWQDGQATREVSVARRKMKGGQGPHRKSVRSRRVVLGEAVRESLREFLRTQGTADPQKPLFTGADGLRPLNSSRVRDLMVRAAVDSGVDPLRISTHTGRKTFVGRVYQATGHNLIATQRIVGHASCSTTARYIETDPRELYRIVQQLRISASP